MSFVGVEVETGEVSSRFFNEVNDRLKDPNVLKNPFVNSKVHFFDGKFHIVEMNIIFPDPSLFFAVLGGIFLAASYFFSFMIIAAGTMFVLTNLFVFLFSPLFPYFFLRIGLRKAGYRGKIKRVSSEKIISRLLNESDAVESV
jgi:hypothetical protein